ncbi:MAG: alpha/beta fold hydrolase [Pseudomonadota bacterium]
MRAMGVALALTVLAAQACAADPRPPPMSIDALREHVFDVTLERVRPLEAEAGYSAYLVAYEHAGLKLHAMVAVPDTPAPAAGFAVVVANHGYVPDPRRYGITSGGVDARPGDYYRSVPGLFATRGFLTVIPDYRGHNSSEGFAFVDPQDDQSVDYYAEDVAALLSSIDQLEQADANNVFFWSHSMGGSVALRVLLATDDVRAASFWATMNVDGLADQLDGLDGPVIVHHAVGDTATRATNSLTFARALADAGRLHALSLYPESDHYFATDRREAAADADVALFLEYLK